MPVATWGYEKDVPPPVCPVGMSPAVPALVPVSGAGAAPPRAAYPQRHQYPTPQYPVAHPHGSYYAHGGASQFHAPAPVPQTTYVGGQARRNGAGGRRLTAA